MIPTPSPSSSTAQTDQLTGTAAIRHPDPSINPDRVPLASPLFDPMGLGALPNIPLIPEATLRRHHAFVPSDDRFRAAARFLQCLWRQDRGLPVGSYTDSRGKRHKLGSRLTPAAGRAGANFVNSAIARLVQRELLYQEIGAVIPEERLFCNALSSQPLTFNLFGHLKLDLALATAVCELLLPGVFREVVDVRFEHSPARGHLLFTADGTAWDVVVRGFDHTGARTFVGVEVKYSEIGNEPLPRFSGRHDAIAGTSGLFVDPEDPALRKAPVQQLFRQANLGITMLDQELYDRGLHLLVAPADNLHVQRAATTYAAHLKDPEGGRLPFRAITMEAFIAALAEAGEPDLARQLHRRYCDFHLIEGELELEAAGDEEQPASAAPAPAATAA